jgi:hypothetical protein
MSRKIGANRRVLAAPAAMGLVWLSFSLEAYAHTCDSSLTTSIHAVERAVESLPPYITEPSSDKPDGSVRWMHTELGLIREACSRGSEVEAVWRLEKIQSKIEAATPASQTEQLTAEALNQRGLRLRAEIDAAYRQLRISNSLKNAVNDGNDVASIVLKYILIGMSFDDAESILRTAGCKIEVPRQGHILASTHLKDRFFDLKHAFAVDLAPLASRGFVAVNQVRATIYLEYAPNANRR